MLKFTIATLAIVALLLIGALVGGVWIWAGLIYITVFAYAFDRLTPLFFQNADTDAEFPTSDALGVALAFAHFIVLGAVVYTLVHNATLPMLQKIALFCATALFAGQIGHPNAHELIHRPNRLLRRLGKAVYMSILMRHHASAHPLVHHVHVGTSNDPVSAPKGRGFWRFLGARGSGRTVRATRPKANVTRVRACIHTHCTVLVRLPVCLAHLRSGASAACWFGHCLAAMRSCKSSSATMCNTMV